MSPILLRYGLSKKQLSIALGCTSLIGMFGMISTGWFVEETNMFKRHKFFGTIWAN